MIALRHIPTNILSGFLGVGKTTAILHLLQHKPATQKWAVLVNEFGRIGIDGKHYRQQGIAVREIPGGCMCCAQGLPLQVAVNRLLRAERPQRLLIESSGVGHPAGVLKTLRGDGLRDALHLQAGICLLDPMHLLDARYRQNALFLEQLAMADVLVANKTDLASAEALLAFQTLAKQFDTPKALLAETRFARLQADWLQLPHVERVTPQRLTTLHSSADWQSHSFEFDMKTVFDRHALQNWLAHNPLLRIKGIVQTADGGLLINATANRYRLEPLRDSTDNLIEVIDTKLDVDALHAGLQACIRR